MIKYAIGLFTCLIPAWALACGPGEKPAFSCLTDTSKQVQVCQGASAIAYRYGKPGKPPELVISQKNAGLVWEHGEGVSVGIMDELKITNGNTSYRISHTADFHDPLVTNAHIQIDRPGKETEDIECTSAIVFTPKNIKARSREMTESASSF